MMTTYGKFELRRVGLQLFKADYGDNDYYMLTRLALTMTIATFL